jgi:hypothetical protein
MRQAWIFVALVACSPAAPAKTVSLRMKGAPPQATVTVDDQIVGSLEVVAARGVALPPGRHRISVEAPGYLPWDKLIEATETPMRLDVQLVPIPD